MQDLTPLQCEVYLIIKDRSIASPITGRQIIAELNIDDDEKERGANLRSVVNALRDKGYPICSNSIGYYYPHSPGELREYIESFQNRIDQQQKACDVLKAKLENWKDMIEARAKLPYEERMKAISQQPLF